MSSVQYRLELTELTNCDWWAVLPMNSVTQWVAAISAAVFLSACCPSVMWLTAQYSGWGLLAGSCTAWENRCSLHAFTFPREESQVEKGCLGTELCHLKGAVMRIKLNCSSYLLQCVLLQFLLHGVLELPHWALGLFRGFFSHVWLSQCSPGALWPHSQGLYWFMGHFRVQSHDWGVYTYYLTHQWKRLPLDPLAILFQIPQSSQSHFC